MFIAEIGINHNGSLDLAYELIRMAKCSGADVVKFQKRSPDDCVPELQKNDIRQTPWGNLTYLDYKKKIEFEKAEYDAIDAYCKTIGIRWTASVWDKKSLEFLCDYDIPFIKIPSALLCNEPLLKSVAGIGKPIVMSTGMSTDDEIKNAIKKLKDYGISENQMTIMACCSAYPAPVEELNLNTISYFMHEYPQAQIGFSSHSLDVTSTIIAKALGCSTFEHHITFDKKAWGSDHNFSLTSDELSHLIRSLEKVSKMMGAYIPEITKSEVSAKNKLQSVSA